jgi:hypothetical protein
MADAGPVERARKGIGGCVTVGGLRAGQEMPVSVAVGGIVDGDPADV